MNLSMIDGCILELETILWMIIVFRKKNMSFCTTNQLTLDHYFQKKNCCFIANSYVTCPLISEKHM
jgi:D-alanyl-lipoteichoic acid acyltransferase DltB (MBOAT superfamily)